MAGSRRARSVAVSAGSGRAVLLVCADCDHTWEVEPSAAGSPGCQRCGGWTWIGEMAESGRGGAELAEGASVRGDGEAPALTGGGRDGEEVRRQ